MKLVEINCPNCKGTLKVNPEKDVLVCGYCHTEFKVDDEVKKIEINKTIHHIYTDEAKIMREENNRIKEEERNKNKREKLKQDSINTVIGLVIPFFIMTLIVLGCLVLLKSSEKKSIKQEQQLQQIVEDVKSDVSNGNYDEAYLKAKSIYYTENYSDEIKEKWDNTRKEMIDYVIKEEKKATGKSEHKSESGIFDKIFK